MSDRHTMTAEQIIEALRGSYPPSPPRHVLLKAADEIEIHSKENDKLFGLIKWILNDASYKAPEQINAEFVRDRYLIPLQEAINEIEKR